MTPLDDYSSHALKVIDELKVDEIEGVDQT